MSISGPAQLASNSSFACSAALPVLNGAVFTGQVPAYTTGNDALLRFLLSVPSGGDTNNGYIASLTTTGTVQKLNLIYGTGGILTLQGFDSSGTMLFTTGANFGVNGVPSYCDIYLQKAGSDVTCGATALPIGSTGVYVTHTVTSATVGKVTSVTVNGRQQKLTGTAVGHFTVQSTWDSLFDIDNYLYPNALQAWTGETAGIRFKRLCAEEGIAFRGRGNLDQTVAMGAQTLQTLTVAAAGMRRR